VCLGAIEQGFPKNKNIPVSSVAQLPIFLYTFLFRAIPLKTRRGERKWPFCLRGSNRPVWGGTENPCFVLEGKKMQICVRGGSQEKVSEGG